MGEEKLYAERDAMAMDIAGNHYCRHVSAMTREQLHSKSDIAAELGWRDMQIAELKAQRDALAAENARMKKAIKRIFPEGVADERGGIGFSDAAKECYSSATESPATDAYLNSLRADGVEMFAAHLRTDNHDISICKMLALGADEFAAQLRAGEPS